LPRQGAHHMPADKTRTAEHRHKPVCPYQFLRHGAGPRVQGFVGAWFDLLSQSMESQKQFNSESTKRNGIRSHRKSTMSGRARGRPPTLASPVGISDQKIEARKPRLELARAYGFGSSLGRSSAVSSFVPFLRTPLSTSPGPSKPLLGSPDRRWPLRKRQLTVGSPTCQPPVRSALQNRTKRR
jgi:hypothetical protein